MDSQPLSNQPEQPQNVAPPPDPYHYTADKNLIQHLIDWALPIGLFLIYFVFYSASSFTLTEIIKTTGLVAISLLSITLFVGSIGRFFSSLNILKAHRKFWGVSSFFFVAMHGSLVLFFDHIEPSDFPGIAIGLLAFFILVLVVLSSDHHVLRRLHPGVWKKIQTTSYIALILAIAHFYVMEQQDGVLVIKRTLGTITYWFATIVIVVRLVVFFFPKKVNENKTHSE